MGCCTYFSKTWRPGYGPDFIDPNKAFNFERRLRIIKRIAIALLILAVLIAVAYLLVSLASSSNENCSNNNITSKPDNTTHAEANLLVKDNASTAQPESQPFIKASIVHPLPSNTPASASNHEDSEKIEDGVGQEGDKSEEEKILDAILGTNGSSLLIEKDLSKLLNESEVALVNFEKDVGNVGLNTTVKERDHKRHMEESIIEQNDTTTVTSIMTSETHPNGSHIAAQTQPLNSTDALNKNSTNELSNPSTIVSGNTDEALNRTKLQNAKNEMWCSYTHNVLECVALSKNFKKVTTFLTNRTYHGNVEGYVLVKVNNTWHPYCRQEKWNLKMGYSLCKAFGFENLHHLNTIDISELKQRITSLGNNVSLQPGTRPQKEDILIIGGNKSEPVSSKARDAVKSEFSCKVGFVSCNNNL
ncbi:unnamed protein product [Orchesella dallaii]|uniref:SRCR domain-containing protein n=1 Tax=Orchesella dallaii TaxID=48710 RepID=A0ABP1PY39_9HEXA